MDFKTSRIRKHKLKENVKKINKKKTLHVSLPLFFGLAIIAVLAFAIVKTIASIDFNVLLKAAGNDLESDSYEHTNFLVMGNGGKEHEGSDLIDTMIVASVDPDSKQVTMISIPRDLYVEDLTVGSSKINEVYYNAKNYYGSSVEGIEHLKSKVEIITGVPIHYWIKVNFDGFKDLIDALGGVDINVEESIYDPYYPKDGTYLYEAFSISAGQHHMDGETALKYARSRKTTSDFDRANRQQQIIYAIKEKALQTNIILDGSKINNVMEALSQNIETNISAKEILTLGSMATEYSTEQISHRLIHDDPNQCGGLVYNPSWELYGGLFVLIPAGGEKFLHLYSDLHFNTPKAAHEQTRIAILNGSTKAGAAAETKQILRRFCFDVTRFGNAKSKDILETNYYYREGFKPEGLTFLQKIIPGNEITIIPQEYEELGYLNEAQLIIEIGSDYTNSNQYLEDDFYYILLQQAANEAAEAAEEAAAGDAVEVGENESSLIETTNE
jgi:LCP family protein required for cell wall assembly